MFDDQPQPVLPLDSTDPAKSRWTIVLTFVLVFLLLCWAGSGMLYRARIMPPGHVDTLAEFRHEMPAPARTEARTIAGKGYTVHFARTDTLLAWAALPSGPAAYVFDDTGALVDLSLDSVEDETFRKRWHLDRPTSAPSPATVPSNLEVEEAG